MTSPANVDMSRKTISVCSHLSWRKLKETWKDAQTILFSPQLVQCVEQHPEVEEGVARGEHRCRRGRSHLKSQNHKSSTNINPLILSLFDSCLLRENSFKFLTIIEQVDKFNYFSIFLKYRKGSNLKRHNYANAWPPVWKFLSSKSKKEQNRGNFLRKRIVVWKKLSPTINQC